MKTIVTLIMTAFGMAAISQASVILTLDPGGAISGAAAGTTTGWGFTLSSDTDFAVITSSNFCIGGTGVTDPCAESTLGTYSDYIAANFTIAGPSPESPIVSQTFNATVFSGLGSFLIRGGEANGANDTGQVVVTYDLYSVDPMAANFDPIADLLSAGNYLTNPASVTVARAEAIPEPAHMTFGGFILGCLFVAVRRRWSKRKLRDGVLIPRAGESI